MDNDKKEIVYFVHTTKDLFDKEIKTNGVHDNFIYFVKNENNEYKIYKGNKEIIVGKDYINKEISNLLKGAPENLDTLKELVEAIGKNGKSVVEIYTKLEKKANQTDVDKKANISELATKQDKLVSGTNIKTINGKSILDSGDIEINPFPNTKEYAQDFLTKNKEIKKEITNNDLDKWLPTFRVPNNAGETDNTNSNGYTPIHLGAFAEYITSTINSNNFDLSNKQDVLKDKINIKTINEKSILGQGDMYIREFPTEYPDRITAMASNFLRGDFSFTPMDVKMHPPFQLPMFYYDFRDQSNLASLTLDELEKLMRKYTLTPFIKEQEASIDTPEIPAEILVSNEPGKVIIPYEPLQSFPSCFNFVLDVITIENNTPVKMVSITLDFNALSAMSNGRTFLNYKGKRYTLEIRTEISKINPRYYQVQHIELRLTHSEDNSPCDISKSKLRAEVTKWWGD